MDFLSTPVRGSLQTFTVALGSWQQPAVSSITLAVHILLRTKHHNVQALHLVVDPDRSNQFR